MADLIEFFRARLDEEEARAKDAHQGNFRWYSEDKGVVTAPDSDGEYGVWRPVNTRADSYHIAYWDPARVLADIAAKRAILDLHEPSRDNTGLCSECGCPDCWPISYPCPTLLALAQPFADHPDFDPAWATP